MSKNKELLILGQKLFHGDARIIGTKEGLLTLSGEIRKAAMGHPEESALFIPPDGEEFQVSIELIEEGTIGKYSSHYCDLADPDRNLLPENILRAVVLAKTLDERTVVRIFDGVENGDPTYRAERSDPELDAIHEKLMALLSNSLWQNGWQGRKPDLAKGLLAKGLKELAEEVEGMC